MKAFIRLLAILSILFSVITEAAAIKNVIGTSPLSDKFHLDQSQNIYFDSLTPSSFALQLLQVKNKFNNAAIFGGSLELDWQRWWGNQIVQFPFGNYQQGDGVFITAATLDLMNNVTPWFTVFFSITDNHIGRNDLVGNNVYTPYAFALLGNLEQSPFYALAGISYIPFGVFTGSGPWDTPLTEAYFSPSQAPQICLGFSKKGWNGEVSGFEDQVNYEYAYAFNLSYNKSNDIWSYGLGAGYLTKLKANNNTYSNSHRGITNNIPTLLIENFGGVIDLNANVSYKKFSLSGEYVTGSKTVFNNQGKPQAYAIILNYVKTIADKDVTFGLSRSATINMKDVPTPLPGYDTMVYTLTGLRELWSFNIMRPIIYDNVLLGLSLQKAVTNPGTLQNLSQNTYAVTLDLMAYL